MCHYLGGGLHGRQKRVKAQSESSKSVVNSVLISREMPVFPGFLEIIRVVISNNKANQYSPVVTAVAMSTKTWKKKYLPTHCPIPAAKVKVTDTDFEVFDSMALCEQIVSIDVNVQIERVVASISDTELLDKITECVKIQIGAYEKYN